MHAIWSLQNPALRMYLMMSWTSIERWDNMEYSICSKIWYWTGITQFIQIINFKYTLPAEVLHYINIDGTRR